VENNNNYAFFFSICELPWVVYLLGNGFLYDTTSVTITTTDLNDNAPVFIRPLFTGGREAVTSCN